jgi:molybdopterin converting factor small subunit
MEIVVRLWGNIGYYLPEERGKFTVRRSLKKGQTVQDIVEGLNLPKDLDIIIAVNEKIIEDRYELKDGDEVALFRPASGG